MVLKMGMTFIEKVFSLHSDHPVVQGETIWTGIDIRSARDFGGANVVRLLEKYAKKPLIHDPEKTYFTFDCNIPPTTSGYADNQHLCRKFARKHRIRLYDIDNGIGSHILLEKGHVYPGAIIVGTDSHLNIMGAVGAFGQGMGDTDIAFIFNRGQTWFDVAFSYKINVSGKLTENASAKDLTLSIVGKLKSTGLLGVCAEFYGDIIDELSLAGRITLASMGTEMGAIAIILPKKREIIEYLKKRTGFSALSYIEPDSDAEYKKEIDIDLGDISPVVSKPYSPHNVIEVSDIEGLEIDSGFVGSCTNGRFEDMYVLANILKGKRIKDGFLLKVVPATSEVYNRMLETGILKILRDAGAMVGIPGCGGCASGQIGIIGEDEIQLSTSNRNFKGKQGKGETYLTSPAVVAASALTGKITLPPAVKIPTWAMDEYYQPASHRSPKRDKPVYTKPVSATGRTIKQKNLDTIISGRIWVLEKDGQPMDNIDTDMIFHNRYLHITDVKEMGKYALDNLDGYEDFSRKVKPGDIIVAGENFGCGSSRAQAVDCFKSLGIALIIARSFGAIYRRNAINSGLGIMVCDTHKPGHFINGDEISVNIATGKIINKTRNIEFKGQPFLEIQLSIYSAGGLWGFAENL